jgi:hypothetical protein
MSARTRIGTVGAVTVSAAIAGGALLLPGVAQAATPATSASSLTLTVGAPAPAGALTPGGGSQSFTVTVANSGSSAQPFTSQIGGKPQGSLALTGSDAAFQVAALPGTPATGGALDGEDGQLLGAFYPQGGRFGDAFSIPAHTTYSWKVTLGVNKSWPVNDSDLDFYVLGNTGAIGAQKLDFKVGDAGTGGPVLETFGGSGSTIAPGQPLVNTLTITNKSGAPLTKSWQSDLSYGQSGKQTGVADHMVLAMDEWTGAAWKPIDAAAPLAHLQNDLPNGASVTFTFRVRLVKYSAVVPSGPISVSVDSGFRGPSVGVQKDVTVYAKALPAGAPSTSPTRSATAAPSAAASASAATGTGTASPSAPASAPAAVGGGLAHTGGGSNTSLLAGGAMAFVGAGLAVTYGLRRRTGGH